MLCIETMGVTQTQTLPVQTMQAREKCGRHKKAASVPTQSSDDKRDYTNSPACQYCESSHAPRQCSAFGKLCGKCEGSNQFASVCLKGRSSARSSAPSRRPVYTVESGVTSGLFIGTVCVGEIDRSAWHAKTLRENVMMMMAAAGDNDDDDEDDYDDYGDDI